MDIQLYRIRLSLVPNTYFLFEPINYYYIDTPIRRVLIYQISYTDNTNPANNMTTRIPYYISDGHTNHFRANMIYPFICFNNQLSQTTCPFVVNPERLPEGGLIKLNIGINFDTSQITDWIHQQIGQHFDQNLFNFMDEVSRDRHIGVISVLPRITNILDFFIAITSDSIINLRPSVNYRPVYTPRQEYNIDFVDNHPYMLYYGLDPQNIQHQQQFNNFLAITDYYRQLLCVALHDQYIHYVQYNIINHEPIVLPSVTVSMLEFNRLMITCNGDQNNLQPHLSPDKINSVQIFASISHLLYTQLKEQIELHMEIYNQNAYNFFNNVNNMLIPALYNAPFNQLLQTNIDGWNARCYRTKYLKYKQKYLKLKKI